MGGKLPLVRYVRVVKTLTRRIGLPIALVAAFVGGAACWELLQMQLRKAHPCGPVYLWEPDHNAWGQVFAADRDCTRLGPEVIVAGTWHDVAYASRFVPDEPANLPANLDLSLLPLDRYRLYWTAGLRGPPEALSGRNFRVTVRARFGRLDHAVTDGTRNLLFVDEVVAANLLPKQ
jgi:hypothetical protein